MNITVIGVGRLGLCFSLLLEKNGYNVLGVDTNRDYVSQLNNKSFNSQEKGVSDLLRKSSNFKATIVLADAIDFSDLFFIVVATNTLQNGFYDHSIIEKVTAELLSLPRPTKPKHIIICSTTIPGFCDTLAKKLEPHNYTVSYNPEFIAQGTILRDQASPDMVLIGENNQEIGDILEAIYHRICSNQPVICRMSRLEAEITKLAVNCFLAMKISYANMIGDLALQAGVNPDGILHAVGQDTRIGTKCLRYGFGYGGPCIPRDARALSVFASTIGMDTSLALAADTSNIQHLENQISNFIRQHPNLSQEEFIFDSITYKPGTDILEESQQLKFVVRLATLGYTITVKESKAIIEKLQHLYGDIFKYEEKT